MNKIKKVIFPLVTLALFIFMGEMTLRILRFPAILIDSKVKALIECRKETVAYYKKYDFNKLGLRGNKETLPKQNDVYRIVCIGDSWTFGLGVPEDKSYPAFLGDLLNKSLPGMKIEVVNAGISSYRVEEIIHFLEMNINVLTPDCIIFLGGSSGITADEVVNPWNNRYLNFYSSRIGLFLSKSYLYNALSNLVLDLKGLQCSEKDRVREGMVIAYSADLLDRLQKEGKTIILLNYPLPKISKSIPYNVYQGHSSRSIDLMLKTFMKKNSNFVFIDLYNIFKKIENCNDLFLKMCHTHLNEAGYNVMSGAIGAYLRQEPLLLRK
ncbi:MAG: SGNH/GDSL hydrolase family protein [Candidatus Omnitrophota bacterium]|jgi:lysophospholipase L1-like esterase